MFSSHVGQRLRQLRESLGLTQEDLARRVETSQAAVSYVEGRARLRRPVIERYALALGVEADSLLADSVEDRESPRESMILDAFEVVCRDEDFGFGARGDESLSVETILDIVRLYERYKGVHLLPPDFA